MAGRFKHSHGNADKTTVRALSLTIRKVLRSGETSFVYEREGQPRPKLGQWMYELEKRLAANELLSCRDRLGLIRIFEDLRVAGN